MAVEAVNATAIALTILTYAANLTDAASATIPSSSSSSSDPLPSFPSLLFDPSLMSSTGDNSSCNGTDPTGPEFYFTAQERSILWTTTIIGTCLSILGTSLITLSYIIYPSLRTFPYKLIVLISVSDLLGSISYLIPTGDLTPIETPSGRFEVEHITPACIAQASMSQLFAVASFIWTSVFSYNIYEVLVKKRSNVETFERYYHLLSWGLPAIFLAINLGMKSFGPTLVWCWIDSRHNDLRMATFYGPLVLIFIINLVFYTLIGRSLKTMEQQKQSAINSRLRQYLLVFFFVRIWSLVNRFQNVIQPGEPVFFLYFMHSFASTLQGFCNACVYGLNVRVRAHYAALCCCCLNNQPRGTGGVDHKQTLLHHDGSGASTPKAAAAIAANHAAILAHHDRLARSSSRSRLEGMDNASNGGMISPTATLGPQHDDSNGTILGYNSLIGNAHAQQHAQFTYHAAHRYQSMGD